MPRFKRFALVTAFAALFATEAFSGCWIAYANRPREANRTKIVEPLEYLKNVSVLDGKLFEDINSLIGEVRVLEEFTTYQWADRNGWNNTPKPARDKLAIQINPNYATHDVYGAILTMSIVRREHTLVANRSKYERRAGGDTAKMEKQIGLLYAKAFIEQMSLIQTYVELQKISDASMQPYMRRLLKHYNELDPTEPDEQREEQFLFAISDWQFFVLNARQEEVRSNFLEFIRIEATSLRAVPD